MLLGLCIASMWLLACSATPEKDPPSPSPETPSVLARIGDVEISRSQVEERLAPQLRELDQQRYQLIEQGLEAMINEKLVEIVAADRGLSTEELLASEVGAKVTPVSESEIDRFYEQRRSQIGQPKEAVAGNIRQYLEQTRRQEVMTDWIAGLREEHQAVILLEPRRVEVETAGSPAKGPESAPVTIVEFSDFQCPFCSRIIPSLDRVTETYPESVRLVFRQFPLESIHPEARKAAEASLCAHDQGKFWEMHDAMFANQSALGASELEATAARLGLEPESFGECLDSGKYGGQVDEDLQAGMAAGVSGTPALFINGRFLSGAQPYEEIAKVIDDELRRAGG